MQLDTTIEQRLKELEQVNDEIEQARNDSNQNEETTQKLQIELLSSKLEKSKNLFDVLKFQQLSKKYDDISTSKFHTFLPYTDKFKSSMREEQAVKALDDARTQNAVVEEIVERIRQENPQFDIILSKIIQW